MRNELDFLRRKREVEINNSRFSISARNHKRLDTDKWVVRLDTIFRSQSAARARRNEIITALADAIISFY